VGKYPRPNSIPKIYPARQPSTTRATTSSGVGTKAGQYGPDEFGFSADRIRRGFEESLRRLGTGYVDILQLHNVEFVDLEGPIGEGHGELVRLREAGMCRFIGMTGYPTAMARRVMSERDLDVT
jgi:L-galactose dehydrogenase